MATSTFTTKTQYRGYTLRLDVTQVSSNTTDNTSKIYWYLSILNGYKDGVYARFNSNFHYSVTIDGSERVNYTGNVNTTDIPKYDIETPHFLADGYYTVKHNNDGTKTIKCSAECSGGGSTGPGTGSLNGTKVLDPINRKAKITSFSGHDIDNDFSVGYTKYVSSWNYFLVLSLSNDTRLDKVLYNTSGAIYKLPDSAKDIIYNAVGNNDTVDIKATIETWNGNTKVGTSSALTNTCTINRNLWLKVNGTWKRGIPHVNINGVWKKGIPYIKINGEWKKAI